MPLLAVFERARAFSSKIAVQVSRRKAGSANYCVASQFASAGEVKSVSLGIVTVPLSAP